MDNDNNNSSTESSNYNSNTDQSDNSTRSGSSSKSDNSIVSKQNIKGGRQSRKIVFKQEREKILQRLYDIVGVTEDNKRFFLYDIENGKIDAIMALQDDVRKYFNAGSWAIFCKEEVVRPYMSLIRSILKDMGLKFYTVSASIKRNGNNNKIRTTRIDII